MGLPSFGRSNFPPNWDRWTAEDALEFKLGDHMRVDAVGKRD